MLTGSFLVAGQVWRALVSFITFALTKEFLQGPLDALQMRSMEVGRHLYRCGWLRARPLDHDLRRHLPQGALWEFTSTVPVTSGSACQLNAAIGRT